MLLAQRSFLGLSLQIFKFLTIPTLPLSFTVPLARVPPQTSVWSLRLLPLDVTGPFFPIWDQITSPSQLGFPSPLTMLPMSDPPPSTIRKLIGMFSKIVSLLCVLTPKLILHSLSPKPLLLSHLYYSKRQNLRFLMAALANPLKLGGLPNWMSLSANAAKRIAKLIRVKSTAKRILLRPAQPPALSQRLRPMHGNGQHPIFNLTPNPVRSSPFCVLFLVPPSLPLLLQPSPGAARTRIWPPVTQLT